MDAVTEALSSVGDAVSSGLASAGALVPEPVASLFAEYTTGEFLKEWVPILYVSLLPLICMLFMCICTGGAKKKVGLRILRRVNIAVKADLRFVAGSSTKNVKGYASVDVEKGKSGSPIKNKAADVQQEKAIKGKATKK